MHVLELPSSWEEKHQRLRPRLNAKLHLWKLNLAHIRACFLTSSKSIVHSLFPFSILWCSHPFLYPRSNLFFCLCSLIDIQKGSLGLISFFSSCFFSPLYLCLLFAVISCVSRPWLPDQAADGSGRRSLGACLGGGSRPHRHMRCLRSLHLCSAWQ